MTCVRLTYIIVIRFKGAWAAVHEKEPCSDIFGEMDVVGDNLSTMADGIIAISAKY